MIAAPRDTSAAVMESPDRRHGVSSSPIDTGKAVPNTIAPVMLPSAKVSLPRRAPRAPQGGSRPPPQVQRLHLGRRLRLQALLARRLEVPAHVPGVADQE